jgi:hypothetical protein
MNHLSVEVHPDAEWCMEHGIVPPIHARRSVDGTMILLHEDFVAPVLGEEGIPSYLYDSEELQAILQSLFTIEEQE